MALRGRRGVGRGGGPADRASSRRTRAGGASGGAAGGVRQRPQLVHHAGEDGGRRGRGAVGGDGFGEGVRGGAAFEFGQGIAHGSALQQRGEVDLLGHRAAREDERFAVVAAEGAGGLV